MSGPLCADHSFLCLQPLLLWAQPLCTSLHKPDGGQQLLHTPPAFPFPHPASPAPWDARGQRALFASCAAEPLTPHILLQQTSLCFHSYARFSLLPIKTQLPHLHPARAPLHLYLCSQQPFVPLPAAHGCDAGSPVVVGDLTQVLTASPLSAGREERGSRSVTSPERQPPLGHRSPG